MRCVCLQCTTAMRERLCSARPVGKKCESVNKAQIKLRWAGCTCAAASATARSRCAGVAWATAAFAAESAAARAAASAISDGIRLATLLATYIIAELVLYLSPSTEACLHDSLGTRACLLKLKTLDHQARPSWRPPGPPSKEPHRLRQKTAGRLPVQGSPRGAAGGWRSPLAPRSPRPLLPAAARRRPPSASSAAEGLLGAARHFRRILGSVEVVVAAACGAGLKCKSWSKQS